MLREEYHAWYLKNKQQLWKISLKIIKISSNASLKEAGIRNSEGPPGRFDVRQEVTDLANSVNKKCELSRVVYSMFDIQFDKKQTKKRIYRVHKETGWLFFFFFCQIQQSVSQSVGQRRRTDDVNAEGVVVSVL